MNYDKVWALFYAHLISSAEFDKGTFEQQAKRADEMLKEFKKREDSFEEAQEEREYGRE